MSYFDPPDKTQSVAAPHRPLLHPSLPPLPARIARLPVDARGFPVPWFVEWLHPDGKPFASISDPVRPGDYPDFRVVDARKMRLAVRNRLCWVCGGPLGRHLAFVIGPMCAVNKTSGEPPSHRECALFSATACPFLSKPQMVRRKNDLPDEISKPAGTMIERNPGVTLLWYTRRHELIRDRNGYLWRLGRPFKMEWFCRGRPATREEVMGSIESGLPALQEVATKQGYGAVAELEAQTAAALRYVPRS